MLQMMKRWQITYLAIKIKNSHIFKTLLGLPQVEIFVLELEWGFFIWILIFCQRSLWIGFKLGLMFDIDFEIDFFFISLANDTEFMLRK